MDITKYKAEQSSNLIRSSSSVRKENKTNEELILEYIKTGDVYSANAIVNVHKEFTEICFYKQDFYYTLGATAYKFNAEGEKLLKENPRKFIKENGVLKPNQDITINEINKSINDSAKRAQDSFYGYGLANDWKYFITLSFDGKIVDRNNDEAVKRLWQVFRQKLQRYNRNVKILATPERHDPKPDTPNGALHFHCLVGNINLEKHLSVAINPAKIKDKKSGVLISNPHAFELMKTKFGAQIYNLSLFNYGFSTVVKIPAGSNYHKILNYCIGYVTKQNNIGYNKKKYYRTGNLDYKQKVICNLNANELKELTETTDCLQVKETNRMIIFRKYAYDVREPKQEEHISETKEKVPQDELERIWDVIELKHIPF